MVLETIHSGKLRVPSTVTDAGAENGQSLPTSPGSADAARWPSPSSRGERKATAWSEPETPKEKRALAAWSAEKSLALRRGENENTRARRVVLEVMRLFPGASDAINAHGSDSPRLLQALGCMRDDLFPVLRSAGVTSEAAACVTELLPDALEFSAADRPGRRCGARVRVVSGLILASLSLIAFGVCRWLTESDGWIDGMCRLNAFSNHPCTAEPCTFEVGCLEDGSHQWLVVSDWTMPMQHSYSKGRPVPRGKPFNCCGMDDGNMLVGCCGYYSSTINEFCDNFWDRSNIDEDTCHRGLWRCLFRTEIREGATIVAEVIPFPDEFPMWYHIIGAGVSVCLFGISVAVCRMPTGKQTPEERIRFFIKDGCPPSEELPSLKAKGTTHIDKDTKVEDLQKQLQNLADFAEAGRIFAAQKRKNNANGVGTGRGRQLSMMSAMTEFIAESAEDDEEKAARPRRGARVSLFSPPKKRSFLARGPAGVSVRQKGNLLHRPSRVARGQTVQFDEAEAKELRMRLAMARASGQPLPKAIHAGAGESEETDEREQVVRMFQARMEAMGFEKGEIRAVLQGHPEESNQNEKAFADASGPEPTCFFAPTVEPLSPAPVPDSPAPPRPEAPALPPSLPPDAGHADIAAHIRVGLHGPEPRRPPAPQRPPAAQRPPSAPRTAPAPLRADVAHDPRQRCRRPPSSPSSNRLATVCQSPVTSPVQQRRRKSPAVSLEACSKSSPSGAWS